MAFSFGLREIAAMRSHSCALARYSSSLLIGQPSLQSLFSNATPFLRMVWPSFYWAGARLWVFLSHCQACACGFVDSRHYRNRNVLMHHVTNVWNTVQRTLNDVPVKTRRLLLDVDQPIVLASNYDNGHFQVTIVLLRSKRVRDHES